MSAIAERHRLKSTLSRPTGSLKADLQRNARRAPLLMGVITTSDQKTAGAIERTIAQSIPLCTAEAI
jgi:hypothetical protein